MHRAFGMRVCLMVFLCTQALLGSASATVWAANDSAPGEGVPEGVDISFLATGTIDSLPNDTAWLTIERVQVSPTSVTITSVGPELLFVETGNLIITDELGIEGAYAEGDGFLIGQSVQYTMRAGSEVGATLLHATLAFGDESPSNLGGTTLLTGTVAGLPLTEGRFFLARSTWPKATKFADHAFSGPIGLVSEAGIFAITTSDGQKVQLEHGSSVVINPDIVSRANASKRSGATLLMAGVLPADAPLAMLTTADATQAGDGAGGNGAPSTPRTDPFGGGMIVYGSKRAGQWDLFEYDVTVGSARQLTDLPSSDEYAASFSHSGDTIAYLSDATGRNQVWMMDRDGANQRQITALNGTDTLVYVSWSADDSELLVSVRAANYEGRILKVRASGDDLREFWPAWSGVVTMAGDGRMAYVTWTGSETDIYGVEPNGGVYPLATTPEDEDVPSMSPDGGSVAYNVGTKGQRRIAIVPAGGGSPRELAQVSADDSDPVWSPDGAAIAHVATNADVDSLWIVPVAGGLPLQVSLPPYDHLWYITWGK